MQYAMNRQQYAELYLQKPELKLKAKHNKYKQSGFKRISYRWQLNDIIVEAFTKSEARSKIKKVIGKIPKGFKVIKLGVTNVKN